MAAGLPANFSIVTLGVADLERASRFYRDLGWEQRGDLADGIVWFKTSGSWIGIFGHDALAEDIGVEPPRQADLPEFRGITLAVNLGSREAVDRAFEHVAAVGAHVVKPAAATPWGGYSGYFADPDGHLWEIAHAPDFPIDDQGRIEIGGATSL